MCSIWHFHVSLSSIVTPRNLVSHTWEMLLPPISICTLLVSFLLPLNIIKFDLSTFSDDLLVWSQVATFISSLLNLVLMAAASVPLMNMLVSSANMTVNITSDVIPKSLTYSQKSRGPSMDPWGTPHSIGSIQEPQLLNDAYWYRFDIQLLIHSKAIPLIP